MHDSVQLLPNTQNIHYGNRADNLGRANEQSSMLFPEWMGLCKF